MTGPADAVRRGFERRRLFAHFVEEHCEVEGRDGLQVLRGPGEIAAEREGAAQQTRLDAETKHELIERSVHNSDNPHLGL
jgi:hypothetical protein